MSAIAGFLDLSDSLSQSGVMTRGSRRCLLALVGTVALTIGFAPVSTSPAVAYPNCTAEVQNMVANYSVSPDGHVDFSWPTIPGAVNYAYSFSALIENQWTEWSGWIPVGLATSTRLSFQQPQGLATRISFAATTTCYGSGWSPKFVTVDYQGLPPRPPQPSTYQIDRGLEVQLPPLTMAYNPSDVTAYYSTPWDRARVLALPGEHSCVVERTEGVGIPIGSCTLNNLTPGLDYAISVRLENSLGNGPFSEPVSARVLTYPTAPKIVGVKTTGKSALVRWRPVASQGGGTVARYVAEALPGGRSCEVKAGLADDILSCSITGLLPGRTYAFTVTPENELGLGTPGTSGAKRIRSTPSEPRNVNVSMTGSTATLSWKTPASTGGFKSIRYRASADGTGKTCTTKRLACTFTNLPRGTRIQFTVTALNKMGQSTSATSRVVSIPKQEQSIT